jgi:hypothetical protein
MNNPTSQSEIRFKCLSACCFVFMALLLMLALVFASRVPQWEAVAGKLALSIVGFGLLTHTVTRLSHFEWAALLHAAGVIGLFGFLFQVVDGIQHVIVPGWMDDLLISMEAKLIGTESASYMQRFVHPWLTEGMMFAYVSYVPLLPAVALVCYRSAGASAVYDYLVNLALAYMVCYIGFILFPVASPMYHIPELYTVQLEGGVFTWFGEWMRANQHFAGGSLPSPHCAAGTVMMAMLYRYHRRLFFVLLPMILMLYVSTVYGRYHYSWDGIAGILSATMVLRWSPRVVALFESRYHHSLRVRTFHQAAEPISE